MAAQRGQQPAGDRAVEVGDVGVARQACGPGATRRRRAPRRRGPGRRPPAAPRASPASASGGRRARPGEVSAMSQPRASRRRSRRSSPISGPPGRSTWQTASSLMPSSSSAPAALFLLGAWPWPSPWPWPRARPWPWLAVDQAQRLEVVGAAGGRLRVEVERGPEQAQGGHGSFCWSRAKRERYSHVDGLLGCSRTASTSAARAASRWWPRCSRPPRA